MEAVTQVVLFNFIIALVFASSGGKLYHQQFTIPEEQSTGTVIGRIGSTTSDSYLPPPPYQIYFVSGNGNASAETHFSVSGEDGTIAILSPIDRESLVTSSSAASGSNFRFAFVATSVGGETITVTIHVVDVNDHAPTFPDSLVRLVIPESADVAAARFALPRATDPDIGTNSVQRYRIISGNEDDKFRLISSSTTSGADVPAGTRLELGLQSELDYESRSDYLLVVEAVDGGRPNAGVGTMTVIVSVSDSNDNWPTFDKEQYEAKIAEDSDVGTEVVRVKATDRDSGANGQVRYRIDRVSPTTAPVTVGPVRGRGNSGSATHPFEIGATSGQLVLRRKLDYEMSTGYELVVVAEDAGERSLQRSVRVSIQVQNVNDNPPTIDVMFLSDSSDGSSDPFKSSTSTVRVPRLSMSHFRRGQPVARVYVFDRDLSAADGGSARPPTVSLRVMAPRLDSTTAGSANESFSLTVVPSAQTATALTEYLVVVAADWLSDAWYRLIITAVDSGSLTSSRVVDIFVDDDGPEDFDTHNVDGVVSVNTQRMTSDMLRFNQSAYHASVSTKVLPGTAITAVQANFVATTDIKNLSESNFPSTPPSTFRSIVYSLFIADEAAGVIAINETGSDVSTITAKAQNSRRSMTSDKFRIGRKSGIVRTSGRLVCDDIIEKPVSNGSANVRIVIIATELIESMDQSAVMSSTRRKSRSAAVTLDVKIVNDNSAIDEDDRVTFEYGFYESSVLENATLGHCFLTVSMMGDQCTTNHLRFAISSSSNTSLSTVTESSQMPPAEIYVDEHTGQLCVNASLDYELTPFYELPIIAISTSGKAMASTNVLVRIIDVNDNKPVFSQSAYNVTLTVRVGGNTTRTAEWSEVTVVKATDADSGPCGQVFYYIDAGNEADVFMVDKTSGIIYISWDAYSAYVSSEIDVTYQLTIAASDGCRRRRESAIQSEDGILSTSSKTVVSIRLLAQSETDLSLKSSDIPSFDPILYQFNVSNSENRDHLIGCVAISDVFQGWKRPLYGIKDQLSTTNGWLRINDSTGCILTTTALPHQHAKLFTHFTVYARFERDHTVTHRTNTSTEVYAQVMVEVKEADDSHIPGFLSVEPTLVHLSVREDSPVSTLIYRPSLHAVRRRQLPNGPAGSYIRFVLSSSTPSAAVVLDNVTESFLPHFSVDELTGNVRIIRRLDRETTDVHRLTIKAYDVSNDDVTKSGIPVQHLDIEVRVIDVNDNNPLFDQSIYRCRLPPPSLNNDDVTFGDGTADKSLCTVRATDADQGHAAQLAYYFDDGVGGVLNDADVFQIDPLSGDIWWSPTVVGNEMPVKCPPETYRLTVVAVDNGNPTRSSTSTVIIAAMATGSCQPRFDVAQPVLSVTENSPIGSLVGAVRAMVGVGTERRQAHGVRYTLVANQRTPVEGETYCGADGKFRVDSETGEIFTNVLLDREEVSRYVVTLFASATQIDESQLYVNITSDVIIDVSDVNDNCPIFVNIDDNGITNCGVELTMSENQPSGTTVAILSAADKDTGPNADVVYSLINDSDTLRCAGAFEIDYSSGRLMTTTTNILKRNQTPSCTLKVSATDGGKPQCRTVQIITVYVVDDDVKNLLNDDEDMEDNSDVTPPFPVVPVSNFTFTVTREATPGTTIGYVRLPSETMVTLLRGWSASRSEHRANVGGNSGRSALAEFLYILVRGNHLDQFEIDRLTGAIILVRPLTSCSVYNLQIAAVLKHHESPSRNRSNDEYSGNGSVQQPLGATIYATVRLIGPVQMSRYQEFDQLDPVLIRIRPELPVGSRIFSASSVLTFPGPGGPWSYALTSQRCGNQEGTETDCQVLKIDSSTGQVILFAQPTAFRVIFVSIVAVKEVKMLSEMETPEDGGNVREPAASFTLVVELDLVNDDAPKFDFRLWSVSVDEDALIGQEIIRLNATYGDDDTEVNLKYTATSGILFRLRSGNDDSRFELEQNTGILRISNHLDYEVTSSYKLEVVAHNGAKLNRQSTATVVIEVQNVNDCRPNFEQRQYDAFLSEDTTPETFVLQLTAYDADNGSPMDTTGVRYKMASGSDSEGIFELNATNGALTTVSRLDREKKDKYVITVLATDGLNFDSCDVVIHVTDVNDNWPVFHSRRSYDVTEKEIAQSDDVIAKVYARDADIGNNGDVTYWITGGNIDNVFSIDPLSGGLFVNPDTRGAFLRRQHSNRSATYNLTITATDSGQPVPRTSSSFVVLRVLSNVELTPTLQFQIPEGQYNVTLAEDTAIGTAVLTIRADLLPSRRGTAVPNRISTERYRRADDVRQFNPDKDDRKSQRRQRSQLEEDVADPEIKYSLALDSDVEGCFTVDSQTGVVYLVRSLDYERRQHYRFSVTATLGRGGGSSTSSIRPIQTSIDVEVNVTDVNDSRYVFDRAVYRANISVDASVGERVLTVRAADAVSGLVSVTYSMLDKLTFLDTNSSTGDVFVRGPIEGSVKLASTTMTSSVPTAITSSVNNHVFRLSADSVTVGSILFARIVERGNVAPNRPRLQFTNEEYRVTTDENVAAGTVLLTLGMQTISGPSSTSDIFSRILIASGNHDQCFNVDSRTGNLTVAKSNCIDFEVATVRRLGLLLLSSSDGLVDCTEVVINVRDLNDNQPLFPVSISAANKGGNVTEVNVRVDEGAPRGTVIAVLRAWDADQCSQLRYELVTGNQRNEIALEATPETGSGNGHGGAVLRTTVELDREIRSSYRLVVRVVDDDRLCAGTLSTERYSASATITVTVSDVNDNAPFFPASNQPVNVREDAETGTKVVQITANDIDLDTVLTYRITGGNNGDVFEVDRRTGRIFLVGTLDSQTTPRYVLRIQVSDGVHIASCNLTINVDVVHRRRPVFTQRFHRVSVFESTETGLEVLRVSCNVESDCANFSVVPTDAGFQIDATNGSLYTSKQAVYNSNQPYYLLTITAINPHSEPPITSSVDVLVDVIRSPRLFVPRPVLSSSATGGDSRCDFALCTGRHVFSRHRLAVTENTRPGTTLTTALATQNTGAVSNETSPNIDYVAIRKRYAIVGGNEGGHFVIDDVTGTLGLQSSLDSELRSSYRLVIRSTVGRVNDELSVVAIEVDDVNEFRPKFPVSVYRGTVAEDQLNSAISVFVLSVHANDDDVGRFGLVHYRLAEDHGKNFGALTGNRKLEFEINPHSGDLTAVATSLLADFSRKTYNLTVVATDSGGFSDTAIITVDVVPHGFKGLHSMTQELSLRFIQKSYEFFVPSGSPVGHMVGRVSTAIDGRGRRDKIRYSISSRNSSLFGVDHQSGAILLIANLTYPPDVEHYALPTGEQVLLTARLKLIATRYQDESVSARRHRQSSVAEAIVLIHIVEELSSTSVLPVPASPQNTFDKAQLVLIIAISVVVVVGSLALGIVYCYFRSRRCERHRKLTSATGGFVLGVSGGSGRTTALPIITPMTIALTPVFPSAAKTSGLRFTDTERARPQSDMDVRHSRQKGGCFDDNDVEVGMINEGQQRDSHRVSSSAESSNCSLSSLSRDRQQRHAYLDAGSEADASDSGLVADFSIVHPTVSRSNKTVQPKTNTADRKYRYKSEVQSRRPVELGCSSSSDENDETVIVPQPVYATIIGDVEDAIDSFFQSSAGTDHLPLELQSLYDKYNPVFVDMALLRNDGEKRSSFVYASENKSRNIAIKNRPFPVERYHLNPTSSTKHRNMSNDSGHASSTLSMMSTPPNLVQSSSPRTVTDDDEHSAEGNRLIYPLFGSGIDNWRNSRTSEPAVVTRGANYARQSYC